MKLHPIKIDCEEIMPIQNLDAKTKHSKAIKLVVKVESSCAVSVHCKILHAINNHEINTVSHKCRTATNTLG